jgi:hypothetical protein
LSKAGIFIYFKATPFVTKQKLICPVCHFLLKKLKIKSTSRGENEAVE